MFSPRLRCHRYGNYSPYSETLHLSKYFLSSVQELSVVIKEFHRDSGVCGDLLLRGPAAIHTTNNINSNKSIIFTMNKSIFETRFSESESGKSGIAIISGSRSRFGLDFFSSNLILEKRAKSNYYFF